MKQYQVCSVVFSHDELKTALLNYARDNLVPIPENAGVTIAPVQQQDRFQVTVSWTTAGATRHQDHTS